uniref:Capsid protein n=1 Tax=Wenling longspine snipefish astrovirus TaxID=2116418 RepID=A0A2P1GMG6_9VIRU|nr:capsid protein [Wenling longspine snipefish astrovirus]
MASQNNKKKPDMGKYKGKPENYDPKKAAAGAAAKKGSSSKPKPATGQAKPKTKDGTWKKTETGTGRYTGETLYGLIKGSPDDFETLTYSTNPLVVASEGQDKFLKLETERWSRYKLESFSLELNPMLGKNSVMGTTQLVGVFDNPEDPKGPKTLNSAKKCIHRDIQVGTKGSCKGPRRTDIWYMINPGGDLTNSTPYMMFVALSGKTVRVYGDGNYDGPLSQVVVRYTYLFSGPKDAEGRGTLENVRVEDSPVDLVEEAGKPAVMVVNNTALASYCQRTESLGNPRGLGTWVRKGANILSGLFGVASGVLPPPFNIILNGGAAILKIVAGSTKTTSRFYIYRTMEEAESDTPIVTQETGVTKLRTGLNGAFRQLNHPDPPTWLGGDGSGPGPGPVIPAEKQMYTEFGFPYLGSELIYFTVPCKTKNGNMQPLIMWNESTPTMSPLHYLNDAGDIVEGLDHNFYKTNVESHAGGPIDVNQLLVETCHGYGPADTRRSMIDVLTNATVVNCKVIFDGMLVSGCLFGPESMTLSTAGILMTRKGKQYNAMIFFREAWGGHHLWTVSSTNTSESLTPRPGMFVIRRHEVLAKMDTVGEPTSAKADFETASPREQRLMLEYLEQMRAPLESEDESEPEETNSDVE